MRISKLQKEGEVFVIEDIHDIFYLTGKKVSRGTLCIYPKEVFFLVDGRYLEECQKIEGVTTLFYEKKNEKMVGEKASSLTVFLAGNKLTYERYTKLEKIFSFSSIKNKDAVRYLRLIKEKEEIEKLRKSAKLNKEIIEELRKELFEGVVEEELAWSFERRAREKGAEAMAFSPHVVFGSNSSKPHYRAGKKRLKKGEAVLFDTGLVVDDYVSDCTRSFLFEGKDVEYEKIALLVNKAYDLAVSMVEPGVSLQKIVKEVEQFFFKERVEKFIKHNLGHSLGIEVHEYPTLSSCLEEEIVCEEGMVFTIEPGLYLEGRFGVRYENMVVVTKEGSEIL